MLAKSKDLQPSEEYNETKVVSVDSIIEHLDAVALKKLMEQTRKEMIEAAKETDFLEAARLRNELQAMEQKLAQLL